MCRSIEEYLRELKRHLAGADAALVQDALSDAEEHLRSSLESVPHAETAASQAEVLASILEKYGSPQEVAASYRELEARFRPTLAARPAPPALSRWGRFIRILSDARAWGAFLYMLLGLITGSFYGMWALLGLSFSLFSLIFIIGIPVTGLFLLSVRGIALVEGRVVEALLGERMPHLPLFVQPGMSWRKKFKALISESHTWKALAYLLLQFPLGALYSLATALLFAFAIKSALYPLWYLVFSRPLISISQPYYPPGWMFPLVSLAGLMLLPLTLHLNKWVGGRHGRYAKAMLVRR